MQLDDAEVNRFVGQARGHQQFANACGRRDGDERLRHGNPERTDCRQQHQRIGERRGVYRQNGARSWLHNVIAYALRRRIVLRRPPCLRQ